MMRKFILVTAFVFVLLFVQGCYPEIPEREEVITDGFMYVHFIDVGQGDCIFVQSDDMNMLIDAGNPENGNDICDYLKMCGVDKLDYFVGTHPHSDHIGGAARVLGEIEVDKVFMTDEISTASFFETLLDVMAIKGIAVDYPEIGAVHKTGNTSFEFLSPSGNDYDLNNSSIVMRIDYGETSLLLTGDAEKVVETDLIDNYRDIDADVLKVGHHGSANGTCEAFLNAVSPQIAVIQSGRGNSYGHPHIEVMERLEKYVAEVYRCDEKGTIVLKSDGKNFYYDDKAFTDAVKEEAAEEAKLIGNLNSKKYHVPECGGLPTEKNRIYFDDENEAEDAGFAPCGRCIN